MELVSLTLTKLKLSIARGLSKPTQDKTKDHPEEGTHIPGQYPTLSSALPIMQK